MPGPMHIDVILSPPEIDLLPQAALGGTVCVVFDVLRATSSMTTALAHGAGEIRPVLSIEEALDLKKSCPGALLGGERFGDKIEGFDLGNSPLEYRNLSDRSIITTTTNGTVALRACEKAERVLVGSFLNLGALFTRIGELDPEKLTLVCAGTFRELALEDVIAAGAVCAGLPHATLSDASVIAMTTYKRYECNLLRGLRDSRNGRALIAAGREADVEWCAQKSIYDAIGEMKAGIITQAEAVVS